MFKTVRGRLITIFLMVAVAGWQLYAHGLKLGLDLRGGMHLALEVDDPANTMSAKQKSDAIDRVERIVRSRINQFGVQEPLIQKEGGDRLIVELAGISDPAEARKIIEKQAYLEFKLVQPVTQVQEALPRIDRAIVSALGVDSIRKLGAAVTASGQNLQQLLFGDTSKAGKSKRDSAAAAAAEDSASALRPLSALLNQGDVLGTFMVDTNDVPTVTEFLALPDVQRILPRDEDLQWGSEVVGRGTRNYKRLYVLTKKPFLTGDMLENAVAGRDPQFNESQVEFTLSRAGGRRFEEFSGQHIGDYLAIVLDSTVMSAPVIKDRIGAQGVIQMGNSPLSDAQDLALVLRAGALPVKLKVADEVTVGPSLGQDSIDQGEVAGIVGILAVIMIMILYYRFSGLLAVLALGVYVVLVLGGLAGLNATLTVPGIAGIILSIGMAVDANVLIFERIREELAAGRATRTAMEEGFSNAMSAIVDSNITTLLTALILFNFGTGPVKGFAVTLSIGIVASFISAVFVTRTFYLIYVGRKKASDPISI
ncbi:MAG: protein translocase subunit SecD [Gemmatimonadetes bacterium]|nr:protein translocase subunit SecD [Gemmatimonadota bacterium]